MRTCLAWGFVTFLTSAGALAEGPAEPPAAPAATRAITLEEAIRIGLSRNPLLEATRSEAAEAAAGTRQSQASRWPRLVADAGWRRTDNQVLAFGDKLTAAEFTASDFALDSLNHPDPVSHAFAGLGLEVPLFTSGRIGAAIAASRAGEAGARAGLRAAEADLVARVTEAYFAVSLARAAEEVAGKALQDARGHEDVASARFTAGSVLRSDLLRAQVARAERERDRARREADAAIALAHLRRTLGLGPAETVDPSSPLEDPREDLGGLDRWMGLAAAARPEIEAARRAAEAARSAVRATRAALGPEIAGTARYERNASGLDVGSGSFLVGLGVRWSAFDRGRAARIEAAEERATGAAARARAAEDAARFEVEAAFRDAQAADRDLAAAREGATAAEEARRISAERYAAGLLPLTDLLDTETALVSARLAELAARYEAVVGRVRLSRAAGALPEASR